MTIKEAFESLAKVTSKGMKNPFFVMRGLNKAFNEIAGSVEGGSSYKETVIYTNSGSDAPDSITLSHSYSDYDAIVIIGHRSQYPTFRSSNTYLTSTIIVDNEIGVYDDTMFAWYTVKSGTSLVKSGTLNITVEKIIGIKY